jgi:eukaryotic-like serine/threonine-protein kinase
MGKTLIDDRYKLRGPLGSGGMADVYLAHDEVLDRDVALKLLKEQYAENKEFVERFKREAHSAAALSHPHIVPVFDAGETGDGTYYIAMEYLPGGTLKDKITTRGALPARTAAAAALQIAEALRAAHERGVIHRDVKPHNILITDSGHVKVGDFGIARAANATTTSHLGDILGSVKYMSPEQAMGEPVGPASDLYSLGVVLYEMLTGKVPFEVEDPADVPAMHAGGPPPRPGEVNPEVPEGADALIMRLLAANPEDRYASAADLVEDLGRVRDGLSPVVWVGDDATAAALGPPAASNLTASAPGGTRLRRRKWSPIMAAFMLLALLSAVGSAMGLNPLRGSGVASIPEVLRGAPGELSVGAGKKPSGQEGVEVPGVEDSTRREAQERLAEPDFEAQVQPRKSAEEAAGRVLEQSVPGGKGAKEGSKVFLTVGEAPEVAKVPDLVGLSYPEAENKLEEAGFLLGGVEEAPSETVPVGTIIKQDPPPETTLDTGTYVYLTTSVGPPETDNGGRRPASGLTGSQHNPSTEALGEEEAVAGAVRGHYEAIGAGNFEEAYSYFGPTFRSQHDQDSWISGEQAYEIQSSTIHSLQVDEVLDTTATATVDVSFVDNTGTPRFVIVWSLMKENGLWRLDAQISAHREMESQPNSSPTPTATPTALPSTLPTPSASAVPRVSQENETPSRLVKATRRASTTVSRAHYKATHQEEGFTSSSDAQGTD